MATKKILGIDVEVNDADFRKLEEAFNAWDEKVQKLPEHWADLGKAMGDGFALLEHSLTEIEQHLSTIVQRGGDVTRKLNDATEAQVGFGAATARAGHAMKGLAEHTKGALGSALQLGRFLGFSGALAGIGGGLGIFALANAATNRSRTAGGLGVTPGQLAAFNANLGPFINSPQGLLSGVSNAQIDLQQRGKLLAAGLTGQQIQNENPEQLALHVINNARAEVRRNGNTNGPAAQAAQQLGLLPSDLRNLASLKGSELQKYEQHALRDAKSLGFGQNVADDWRKLDTVLREAGIRIESTLIKGLAPLAGPLSHLSDALVHGIGEVLASKGFRDGINEAATGIESLGKYLSGDAFGKDLRAFENGIKALADNAKAAAIALGVLAGISAADKLRKLAGVVTGPAAALGADAAASAAGAGLLGVGGAALAAGAIAFWPSSLGNDELGASGSELKKHRKAIGILSAEYRKAGLPQSSIAGMLGNAMWEGHLNPHEAQIGGGDGYGIFQWDKARRAQFAKMFGHSMKSATTEEEGAFSIWELKTQYPDVWSKLQSGNLDVAQAAKLVEQKYLMPKDMNDPTGSIIHRTAIANQMNAILGANRITPTGMGASSRSAHAIDRAPSAVQTHHVPEFNPAHRDQLVGLLKSIDRKMSSNSARISITNNSAARVNVQANAAAR